MSGHSKWSQIKHKKSAADAKRGKLFSKLIREISVAAKMGGEPETNARLRKAITEAKSSNMPQDTIQRAIDRGTGKIAGEQYEEVNYEGYGPGGTAVLVEALTDNKNRTVSEIRHIFSKYGGNLGESGCVSWMFHKKGYITIDKNAITEDDLFNLALDAGAEDVLSDDESHYEIITSVENFESVVEKAKQTGLQPTSASVTMIPQTFIKLQGKEAAMMLKLMDMLEDQDDVQRVSANFDISADEMAQVAIQ
jgi:YebC/PmpR family DNA-binding regulatory protein